MTTTRTPATITTAPAAAIAQHSSGHDPIFTAIEAMDRIVNETMDDLLTGYTPVEDERF